MLEANHQSLPTIDEAGLDQVVADPLRFKRRLRIGEEAFALLRAKKNLYALYETAGAAGTGAAIAGSSAVASTFFAPTGLAAALGLATAVTPVGWVVAAAVAAGGSYYGVSRRFSGKSGAFVDTIPKYINTPIDVLGAALIDLFGSLALRVAAIDGRIDPAEETSICDHFVEDWGYNANFVSHALASLKPHSNDTRVKALAIALAQFQAHNPDCNAPAMQDELMAFLRDVVAADGIVDEREELALEAIERVFVEESRLTLGKAAKGVTDVAQAAGSVASDAAARIARTVGGTMSRKLADARQKFLPDPPVSPKIEMKSEALKRLGHFSQIFRQPGFRFQEEIENHGRDGTAAAPGCFYSREAEQFVELCYRDQWLKPDFDWPAWKETEEATALRDRPEALAQASADQLASLLTVLVRQERFVEGSLGAAFASGLLLRIVDRCRELAES